MFFDTNNKAECTACTACVSSCPKGCIDMTIDEEGFVFPIIDVQKCINCNLCRKICPVEYPDYLNTEQPDVFATLLKDKSQRVRSTSGGLFYAIARWVISQGGIVYGATLDRNNQVKHIGVENIEELEKLRGSKYVQSDLTGIFHQIRDYLNLNRCCYFVGTGCQVAGLKAFLRKEFKNLITSDVVCHGVPSQSLFDQHIQYLSRKYNGRITNYQFRDTKRWNGCESFKVIKDKGNSFQRKIPTYYLTPYLYSFMYGMTFRYACYDCKFAKIPRQGDLTLADFWGVKDLFPKINARNGVSLILLNNSIGEKVWSEIKDECVSYRSNIEDCSRKNANLIMVSSMPPIRENIFQLIRQDGYDYVASHHFKSDKKYKIWIIYILESIPIVSDIFKVMVKIFRIIRR